MTNQRTHIYPMMIELNQTIKDTVYYLSLPDQIKKKWIELEKKSNPSFMPKYNLPTNTLKDMFCRHLDGVIDMSPVKEVSNDRKWLVSFKNINLNIVVNSFKIWVEEFYIEGSEKYSYKWRRIYGADDEEVRRLAIELKDLLRPENFEQPYYEEVILFDEGKAVHKHSYSLYPLRIVNTLMGKTINIEGIDTKFLYVSNDELITDTKDFRRKDDYYSFVIRFSVQTIPPDQRAFLNVDLSVRRWISRNENGGEIFLPTNKKCYIRVDANRMQVIETVFDRSKKENVWKSIDARCLKERYIFGELPRFTEVLANPEIFNQGKNDDILIPYQEGIPGIYTSVGSGVAFEHRKTVFNFIKNQVYLLDAISSNVQAFQIRTKVQNRKVNFDKSENFLKQLDKALNDEKLTIEIHAKSTMRGHLLDYLQPYFEKNSKHEIKCVDTDFYKPLDKTLLSKKENLPGFEMRVEEIVEKLTYVDTPTLAIVAIHDKEYYSKLDRKVVIDPKEAIRCGFAKTGRLTQFITFEEFEKGLAEMDVKQDEDKFQEQDSIENNNNKRIVNRAVEGAILDGFRQLGVVFDYGMNKYLKGKKIVAVNVCNSKKTKYGGSIGRFPIILTYDVDDSKVTVYSDLMGKEEIPYWKGQLLLGRLATERNINELNRKISTASIYKKLLRILQQEQKESLIIFDVNEVSRSFIEGITNKKIDSAEKNQFGQIEKLYLKDNLQLNFSEAKRGLSVVRIRYNDDVCSYFPMDHPDPKKENKFKQASGLFKYGRVYYSIDGRPQHENKVYDKNVSKSDRSSRFSHRNMIELYPIYVSGDEFTHHENEQIAVGSVHILRQASVQYTVQKTVLPMPLHLAVKMEEYI